MNTAAGPKRPPIHFSTTRSGVPDRPAADQRIRRIGRRRHQEEQAVLLHQLRGPARCQRQHRVTRTVPSATMRQGIVGYLNIAGQTVQSDAGANATDRSRRHRSQSGCAQAAIRPFRSRTTPPSGMGSTRRDIHSTRRDTTSRTRISRSSITTRTTPARTRCSSAAIFKTIGPITAQQSSAVPGLPANSVSLANSKGLAAGWTDVITPNLVSTLRYGFTRAGNETSGVLDSNYEWFRGLSTPYGTNTGTARIIPVHTYCRGYVLESRRA